MQDLVIRILFILGNLTAKNDQAREQFFQEKGSINTLISLFQTYHELDLNAQKWYQEKGREEKNHPQHPAEAEDVLIKLITVLANLSIHPSIGAALAAAHHVVELLVTVLGNKVYVVFVYLCSVYKKSLGFFYLTLSRLIHN